MPFARRLLIVPSPLAAVELPRRLAVAVGPQAGLWPVTPFGLAREIAAPELLGRGLLAWDSGHDALLAARLLEGPHQLALDAELPRRPVARALARTFGALRRAGLDPERVRALASLPALTPEDDRRRKALVHLYEQFHAALEGQVADPATLFRTAIARLPQVAELRSAEVLIVEELETEPLEREFIAALAKVAQVTWLRDPRPPGLWPGSFAAWAQGAGLREQTPERSWIGPLRPLARPVGLERVRLGLFEPPAGAAAADDSVQLLTAPGEAAEVRSVLRHLLRAAAAGVPFEDMGVVLPRPDAYAALFGDLCSRLRVPFKLHPSLPLLQGRAARALLLLFRCRGLERSAVMEFLTFANIPLAEFVDQAAEASPARWDELSRDARIVSGLERWLIGLRAHAEAEREAGVVEISPDRRESRERRARDAEQLLALVERLSSTHELLAGTASWEQWSERLLTTLGQWIAPEPGRADEYERLRQVLLDLGGLSAAQAATPWEQAEAVIEARLEWERLPLEPVQGGALHVGALDAMAGLSFRVLAIVGLVEGGYPALVRPDPFLLDEERESLRVQPPVPNVGAPRRQQLSLFDVADDTGAPLPSQLLPSVPTTRDEAFAQRRAFQRAIAQAGERLILSYPRADARTGRERLPSLFFVAAASALHGRTLTALELEDCVGEEALAELRVEDALDRAERDRVRLAHDGRPAAEAIAAGSIFFRQSRLAAEARWSSRLTAYDGLVEPLPPELRERLDPVKKSGAISASRLATFSRCGFEYLLRYVLRLEPTVEPEERKRLEPLERGNAFHTVAENFLRELRDRGELPVRPTPELEARLMELGDRTLDELVAGSPPRFTVLWERERSRFRETLALWLKREGELARKGATPAHFELSFGLASDLAPGEPHLKDPLEIDLGDGRCLRVHGRIDRIDRRDDGTLVLRDYKTGRAPRDDGGVFRGGKQLQIPFYVLAAAQVFKDQPVVDAFLDYIDGGRQVAFDPALVNGEAFRLLLRGLVDAIGSGQFVQEPSSCEWCDFTAVCGPQPLLVNRRKYKLSDQRVRTVLRLRDFA